VRPCSREEKMRPLLKRRRHLAQAVPFENQEAHKSVPYAKPEQGEKRKKVAREERGEARSAGPAELRKRIFTIRELSSESHMVKSTPASGPCGRKGKIGRRKDMHQGKKSRAKGPSSQDRAPALYS